MSDQKHRPQPPLPPMLLEVSRLPSEVKAHESEERARGELAGQRARHIRTAQGRTLAEVGAQLGITPQQLGRLETGARTLHPEMVSRLADVLGVPVEAISSSPDQDANGGRTRKIPAHAAVVAEALQSMGFDVQSGETASIALGASVRPDLIARLRSGVVLEHRVIVLCRPQLTERDVITMSGLRSGIQPPHDSIIVVDREPDPRVAAEAARLGITVAVTQDLTASLVDLGPHAQMAVERYYEIKPWFVMPAVRVRGEGVVRDLDDMLVSWLADPATRNLVLLGEPGSGKSICCDWIAGLLADRHLTARVRSPVPVVVKLGQLPYVRDFNEIIVREVERTIGARASNAGAVRHMTAHGRFVILLDGFDEMNVRADQNVLEDNLRAVRELLRAGSRVILTSRPGALGEQLALLRQLDVDVGDPVRLRGGRSHPPISVVTLQEFTDERMRALLHLIGTGDRRELLRTIQQSRLAALARRPLILSLLCANQEIMARLRERGGEGLAAVLREHIELIVERECQRGARMADTLDVLSELALEMLGRNLASIHVRQLPHDLARVVGEGSTAYGLAQDLNRRMRSTFFLVVDDAGQVSFAHRLFQDYLVAWRICEDIIAGRPDRIRRVWIDSSVSPVLGELLREAPLPTLLRAWLDPQRYDEEVRSIAAFLTGVAGLVASIPDLRVVFASDPKSGVRSSAAFSLALLGDREVLAQLLARARSGLPTVERTAARVQLLTLAYMDYPGRGAPPALRDALTDARSWTTDDVLAEVLAVASDPLNGDSSRGAALTVLGQVADPDLYLAQLESLRQREGMRFQMALNRAIAAMRLRMKE